MTDIQSSPELLATLKEAAKRKLTADELHRQKVSYIVSSLHKENTEITTEMVENELRKLDGTAA